MQTASHHAPQRLQVMCTCKLKEISCFLFNKFLIKLKVSGAHALLAPTVDTTLAMNNKNM